jgi:hypothetical protein
MTVYAGLVTVALRTKTSQWAGSFPKWRFLFQIQAGQSSSATAGILDPGAALTDCAWAPGVARKIVRRVDALEHPACRQPATIRLVLDAFLALACLPFSGTSAAEGTPSLSMVMVVLRLFFISVEVHE